LPITHQELPTGDKVLQFPAPSQRRQLKVRAKLQSHARASHNRKCYDEEDRHFLSLQRKEHENGQANQTAHCDKEHEQGQRRAKEGTIRKLVAAPEIYAFGDHSSGKGKLVSQRVDCRKPKSFVKCQMDT
jgi:hypothetical protein